MKLIPQFLRYFIITLGNYHFQGDKQNIFLFSTPRSGSTWVMELIASQPGFKFYDEPLNIRRENVKKAGCIRNWEDMLPGSGKDTAIIDFLSKLECNKIKVMNPPPFRRNHKLITNRIIFKIHEIEHLINEVENTLHGQVVFLLRHPIATTISRNELPRLDNFIHSSFFTEKFLNRNQQSLVRKVCREGTVFEKGIVSWCYQNLIPLKYLDHKNWLIITYEEMVINPLESCKLLCERLQLTDLDTLMKAINLPSTNINLSTQETKKILSVNNQREKSIKLIKKWQNQITPSEKSKAFEILSIFEIDAYSEDSFLAHNKYLNFQNTSVQ